MSVRTAVSLLFLPFVVCFLGPAFGCGRMDMGEKGVAEDDVPGSTHGLTGEEAASGGEDATVGVGAALVEGSGGGRSVTWDGAKSMSLKICLLKGQIPVHTNPAWIFDGVAA